MNLLFEGVTTSPTREFIAEIAVEGGYRRVVLPCVGRYAALAAMVKAGVKPKNIVASDISLFSSVIGYACDPKLKLDDLEIVVEAPATHFIEGAKDELDWAAGVLLATKWLRTIPKNAYVQALRTEWWINANRYRDHVRGELEKMIDLGAGMTFRMSDVRKEVSHARESEGALLYMNLPGYKGGYGKMYGDAERALSWKGLAVQEFDPAEVRPLHESLIDAPLTVLSYVHHGLETVPDEWTKLMAIGVTPQRTDYIVANKPLEIRHAHLKLAMKPPRKFPIYNDEEITPETVVTIESVDAHTALYYRDLFVHRLGSTAAAKYFLLLLDGRVTTAFGLDDQAIMLGRSNYISEVFGISRSSKRYERLGKLFMLFLTSGDMRRYLIRTTRAYTLRDPQGIQTTSLTHGHEGKTDRGVMKLVEREPIKAGGFKLKYRAPFRDDTFSEVIALWLEKFGDHKRDGKPS